MKAHKQMRVQTTKMVTGRLKGKLVCVLFPGCKLLEKSFKVVNMTVVTDIDSLMQHGRERTLTVQGIPEEVS